MKALIAVALPLFVFSTGAGAASSGSFSGNFPVLAQLPPHFADTACLTLVDNGTLGAPHSGPATGTGAMFGNTPLSGTFKVVNGLIVVNLQSGSDTGEVVYLSFIGRARDGSVGNGVYNEPGFFLAALIFGQKGGC